MGFLVHLYSRREKMVAKDFSGFLANGITGVSGSNPELELVYLS